MASNVTEMLRQALAQLEVQRRRLDGQIAAIRTVLGATAPRNSPHARKPLRAAARQVISQRMKAYWAKRKQSHKPASK